LRKPETIASPKFIALPRLLAEIGSRGGVQSEVRALLFHSFSFWLIAREALLKARREIA
jgi:hypothetical protein